MDYTNIFIVFSFLTGASVGSFLNVCGYRIPRDMSLVEPGSYCTNCGTPIPWFYNFPLVSWIWLRGRAACCGATFSVRYWLVELATGLIFAALFAKFGMPLTPIYWLFASLMIVGILTDFDFHIIPDRVTLGSAVLGLLFSFLFPELHRQDQPMGGLSLSAVGAIVGFGTLWLVSVTGALVLKQEAMGFGDVKLMAGIGAFLGWQSVLFCVALGSVLGSLAGILYLIVQGKKWGSLTPIPYGPPLMTAAFIWIFWGQAWWLDHFQDFRF